MKELLENSTPPNWLVYVPVVSSPEITRLAAEIAAGRLSENDSVPLMVEAFAHAIASDAMKYLGDSLLQAVCSTADTPSQLRDLNDAKHPAMQAIKAKIDAGELSRDDAKPLLAAAFQAIVTEELQAEQCFVN